MYYVLWKVANALIYCITFSMKWTFRRGRDIAVRLGCRLLHRFGVHLKCSQDDLLWIPKGATCESPRLLWIHGGSWEYGPSTPWSWRLASFFWLRSWLICYDLLVFDDVWSQQESQIFHHLLTTSPISQYFSIFLAKVRLTPCPMASWLPKSRTCLVPSSWCRIFRSHRWGITTWLADTGFVCWISAVCVSIS